MGTMTSDQFTKTFGQSPEEYAAEGWSMRRLADDLRRLGFISNPSERADDAASLLEELGFPTRRKTGERLTVVVDDGVSAMLLALAGSPRKQGAYLSQLIRTAYGGREVAEVGLDYDALRLTVMGLVGKTRELEQRLAQLETRP